MIKKIGIPPIGHVPCYNAITGERKWIDPRKLAQPPIRLALSESLVKRIKEYKFVLGDADTIPLEETIKNFQRDNNPELEIKVWECIAEVYLRELDSLRDSTLSQRITVCKSIIMASLGMSERQIISSLPQAKAFRRLPNVIKTYQRLSRKQP